MPKPVKKAQKRLPVPPKTGRPSDPNRAAQSILVEHMARMGHMDPETLPVAPPSFQEQYRDHMANLGAKGGKISGAKRMENLSAKERKTIAKKAAAARWAKKSTG
jgi:hypothetical protein